MMEIKKCFGMSRVKVVRTLVGPSPMVRVAMDPLIITQVVKQVDTWLARVAKASAINVICDS